MSTKAVQVVDEGRKRGETRFITVDEAIKKGKRVPSTWLTLQQRDKVHIIDDPAPAVIGGLLFFAGTVGKSVLDRVIDAVASPVAGGVEIGVKYGVVELFKDQLTGVMKSCFENQAFVRTKTDASGVNTNDEDLKKAFTDAMKSTVVLTALISDDAGEIAMESLSEALSQAVYAGLAGQLTCRANYRSGFAPPDGLDASTNRLNINVHTRALLDAFVGKNVHETIANEAMRRIQDASEKYTKYRLLEDIASAVEASSNLRITVLAETERLLRDSIHRLVEDVRAILYTLLRRVTDVLNEVRVAKAEHDAGLLSDEEFNVVLQDANIELAEIENEVYAVVEDAKAVVADMPEALTTLRDNLWSLYTSLENLYGSFVDSVVLSDFDDYVSTLLNLRTYTLLSNVAWKLQNPVTGSEHGYTVG